MIELGKAEGDSDIVSESEAALAALSETASRMEVETLLSGEADSNDCYIEVHAGAGGTESQDWTQMMQRMYLRWAEKKGYKASVIEQTNGDEAGLKSTTIEIKGHNAYGWGKTESGVHRLVRISPFDSNARRHTSFASVGCYPVIDDTIAIDVSESDVRIDTFRASGAGGQHVNTTDSAVRITHIPTNIAVQCQNQRSQHKNRAKAMLVMRARLFEAERQRVDDERAADRKSQVGSGDRSERIRTYNFPQGRVTDHRINLNLYKLGEVMEGSLDDVLGPLVNEFQAEQLASLSE